MVTLLPAGRSTLTANAATINKMNTVVTALRAYMGANGMYPCPADATLATGNTSYGVAAANGGSSTNCSGGSPAANYVDATNNIAIGMIPVRTLGLSNDYALDAYGRAITYAVDTNSTACWPTTSITGKISVTDNGTAYTTPFVLVSHGTDGHGAWVPLTGTGTGGVRLNTGSGDTDQLTNAHVDSSFVPTTTLTSFVRKPRTTTFDDIVVYTSPQWTMSTLPTSYSLLYPTVTGPASSTYILNQKLTFTATYSTAVTVTGTPSMSITVGSNSRTATYSSGSGTTALVFSYTLAPSDYTSAGVTTVTPLSLNGGTITSATKCYGLAFTGSTTAGALVSAPSGATTNNWTISGCSGTGTLGCVSMSDTFNAHLAIWKNITAPITVKGRTGTYGSGASQLANPAFLVSDLSAHYYHYIVDSGNNRIQDVDAVSGGGTFVSNFGSSGNTAGLFSSPMGIALDSSATGCAAGTTSCLWITDTGNNKFQKCSTNMSGGATNCTIYGTGTYGGSAMSNPVGVAVDATATPNAYIVDSGNNRILKFNSSGVYQSTMGTYGVNNNVTTNPGQFNNPIGIALDTTTNCFSATACLWITDSGNNRIQRCSTDMNSAHCTVFGTGNIGGALIPLSNPAGIARDSANNIFVVDMVNNRVIKFTSAGAYVTDFGTYGNGASNFSF